MIDLNALKQRVDAAPKPPKLTIEEQVAAAEATIRENEALVENLQTNLPILTEEQIAEGETPEKFKKNLERLYGLRVMNAQDELKKLKLAPADRFDLK